MHLKPNRHVPRRPGRNGGWHDSRLSRQFHRSIRTRPVKGNTAVRVASRFLGFVVAVLLACPVASAPGVTPDAVVFGQSACFSGPNERLGMHYRAGIMAAF